MTFKYTYINQYHNTFINHIYSISQHWGSVLTSAGLVVRLTNSVYSGIDYTSDISLKSFLPVVPFYPLLYTNFPPLYFILIVLLYLF